VYNPSFDCTKAGNWVEHTICDNNELSKLDSELGTVYKVAKKRTNDINVLKSEQRSWIKKNRAQCKTVECLDQVYRDRIKTLN
jgi:uncharacterized protein